MPKPDACCSKDIDVIDGCEDMMMCAGDEAILLKQINSHN
jgi:hypothetical protein